MPESMSVFIPSTSKTVGGTGKRRKLIRFVYTPGGIFGTCLVAAAAERLRHEFELRNFLFPLAFFPGDLFEDLKVFLRQVRHDIAVMVGDHDVDCDQVGGHFEHRCRRNGLGGRGRGRACRFRGLSSERSYRQKRKSQAERRTTKRTQDQCG